MDGLDTIIEEFKYDGGLVLAEDYIDLRERLEKQLHEFDREGRRKA